MEHYNNYTKIIIVLQRIDAIISILSKDSPINFLGKKIKSMLFKFNMDVFADFSPTAGGFFIYKEHDYAASKDFYEKYKKEQDRTFMRKKVCHHIAKKNLEFIEFIEENNKDTIIKELKKKIPTVEELLNKLKPEVITPQDITNALLEYLGKSSSGEYGEVFKIPDTTSPLLLSEAGLLQLDPATCLAVPYSYCIDREELFRVAGEFNELFHIYDEYRIKISPMGWEKYKEQYNASRK